MDKNQLDTCTYIRHEFGYPAYRISMFIIYSLAALVTTVFNSLVLIAIRKTPSLHKPSYILIGSLGLSDLLVGAIGEPLIIMLQIAELRGWSLNSFCLVSTYARVVTYVLCAISLFTLMVISLDRVLAVKLRDRYQSVVTQKRVLLVLTACWLAASVIPSVLFSYIDASSQIVSTLLLVIGIVFMILVVSIVICYSMAFYTLRKITSSSVSPGVHNERAVSHPSSATSNIDIHKYRRSLITMFVVFIVTILLYTPVVSVSITFFVFIRSNNISSQMSTFDILLVCQGVAEYFLLLNSVINPLLYLWRIRDIREAVKTTVKTALKIA